MTILLRFRVGVFSLMVVLVMVNPSYAIENRYGLSNAQIVKMPICERPQRVGHFYGRFYRFINCGKPLIPGLR